MTRTTLAAGAAAAVLAVGGFAAASAVDIIPLSATETTTVAAGAMGCEDWAGTFTQRECFAAGVIRNVSLGNLQGAAQFCKWRDANPGEWSRLKGYASSGTVPTQIVTWMGGHILNDLQAYFAAGGPAFTILPNTAPNACTGKLLAPPVVQGVTPGQTDATVTVTTTP